MRIEDNIARIVAILMVTLFMSAFSCLRVRARLRAAAGKK